MDSIQWFYRPSEKIKKTSKLLRTIVGSVLHASFIFYYIRYQVEVSEKGPNDNFAIMMGLAYITGVLAFWLFINRVMKPKEKMYAISDNFLEIKQNNGKSKKIDLGKYKSFSTNIRVYTKDRVDSQPQDEKFIYIGKESSKAFLTIEANNQDVDKVKKALKERLKELG